MRQAACACGRLTAKMEGDPIRVSLCHCEACRALSGSAFSWNARYEAGSVTLAGSSKVWTRRGDEGSLITNHFCPDCGVTLYYSNDQLPGMVMVRVGTLDSPRPAPEVSVYDDRRPDWLGLEGDIERWT